MFYTLRRRLKYIQRGRSQRSRRFFLFCLIFAFLSFLSFSVVKLHSMISELASNKVKNEVVSSISGLVMEESEEMDFTKFLSFEKSSSGEICALVSNTVYMNYLQGEISKDIVKQLDSLSLTDLTVPFGSLFKSAVVSGRGPNIPVKILSANTVQVRFLSRFDSTGINQTRHRLFLVIDIDISLHTVGQKLLTSVSMNIPITETVIVGGVPESYTYFEADKKWDETIEKYDILS